MYTRGNKQTILGAAACAVLLLGGAGRHALAQEFHWPEEPENLQVLPEGIKGHELGGIMRGYAIALGVRCDHCHVGEGSDLTKYDFPADDKATKRKARIMIQMLAALNSDYLPKLASVDEQETPPQSVTCMTCHRKNNRPVMLEDVLVDVLHADGIDAAVEKYRQLREQFYGGFAFDFSAGALAHLGERLAGEQQFPAAIRLAELDIEMNGETAALYWTLGNIQERGQFIADALDSYRKGLALAPDDWKPFYKGKLEKLANADN